MPTPNQNEKKDAFISRCIEYVAKEKPDWEQERIAAYCYSIWEEHSSEALMQRIVDIYNKENNALP